MNERQKKTQFGSIAMEEAMAYGAMHQNQAQLRVKFWYIPKSMGQLGRVAHPKGHCPSTLTNEPAPSGRVARPSGCGHCRSTLTNEPAQLGRGAHPKGHRPCTLTNKPVPMGRGVYRKGQ